ARVHELPALVDAQHERAEARRAAAGPLRVAGDYELLLTVRLYFQPVAGAAADGVFRIDALRHDSFELLLGRRFEQRVAVVERLRQAHGPVPPVEQRLQALAAIDERQV